MKNKKYLIPLILFIFLNILHPNYFFEYYFKINGEDHFSFYNKITNSYIEY